MSALSAASQVILRHEDDLLPHRILFAGDLQDTLPCQLENKQVAAWSMFYHQWQALTIKLGSQAHFDLLPNTQLCQTCSLLVYYWPKSKQEAQFQLRALFAQLPVGTEVMIVGENRSGVRSAETLLADLCPLQKIDSARRCSLYYGKLQHNASFDLNEWWLEYPLQDELTIATLPGVFSRDELDTGSRLLLSTFENEVQGRVLDVGCGAGVLSAFLAKQSSTITQLTLCDVNAAALASSRKTLDINQLKGEVIASNVFSAIEGRYDLILSNPPFHDGLHTSLISSQALITGAYQHLNLGGELRIVANAFLPYPDWLDATFGSHEVLAQTGKFKVYRAIRGRPAKTRK